MNGDFFLEIFTAFWGMDPADEMCIRDREYCEKNIPQIKPNIPDATYLVWLDCRDLGMSNEELRKFMIEKAKIGLNEGYTFGRSLTGFMRLNVACPRSVLEKALGQLKDAVDALDK